MLFSGTQWSLWANEQALIGLMALLIGAVVDFANPNLFTYSGIGIFFAISAPFAILLEWPRPRLKGKTKAIERPYQKLLHPLFKSRIGTIARDFFLRSFLYFLIALPGLFLITTVVGSLILLLSSLIYFLAAWKGEAWESPEEEKPSGPVAPPEAPRLLPDGRPYEISQPISA